MCVWALCDPGFFRIGAVTTHMVVQGLVDHAASLMSDTCLYLAGERFCTRVRTLRDVQPQRSFRLSAVFPACRLSLDRLLPNTISTLQPMPRRTRMCLACLT